MKTTSGASSITQIGIWRSRPQLALLALLIGELLYLTISFDTQMLEKAPSIWTVLIGWSPQYLRLAIAIAAVMLLPGGKWLATAPPSRSGADALSRLPFLGLHALVFLVFVRVTGIFFAGGDSVVAHPALWTATWCLFGAATFGSWALAVYP